MAVSYPARFWPSGLFQGSAQGRFDMWTGGDGDRTTVPSISGRPALPPEPQTPEKVITSFLFCCIFVSKHSWGREGGRGEYWQHSCLTFLTSSPGVTKLYTHSGFKYRKVYVLFLLEGFTLLANCLDLEGKYKNTWFCQRKIAVLVMGVQLWSDTESRIHHTPICHPDLQNFTFCLSLITSTCLIQTWPKNDSKPVTSF